MKKLQILEDFREGRAEGYDHIFSLLLNEADSFPEDYLSVADANKIHDSFFCELIEVLKSYSMKSPLVYKGVDLLWCFKKRLLNFVSFVELRYQLLKRILQRHSDMEIHIARHAPDQAQPFFDFIIEHSPLQGDPRIKLIAGDEGDRNNKQEKKKEKLINIKKLWPSCLAASKIVQAEVAIFADLAKSQNVLGSVGSKRVVLYTDSASPRSFFQSLKKGFAFNQAAYGKVHKEQYGALSEKYLAQVQNESFSQQLSFSELDWSKLLRGRLQHLLKTELPKLLFDIDHMETLFQKAKVLKSALLDEDVAPAKNAFCQIAKRFNVTTYVECHGSLGNREGYLPLTANRIFVWGEAQKRKLMHWGCAEERVVVSGRSLYSTYRNLDEIAMRAKVVKDLDLETSKKIVVIALMIFRKSRRRLYENGRRSMLLEVLSLIKKYPDVQFIIKSKNQYDANGKFCRNWIKLNGLERRAKVAETYSSLHLIRAADLILVHNSTFAIDAFAMGKSVISLYDQGLRFAEEFREYGAFHSANSLEQLDQVMDQLIKGAPAETKIQDSARQECLNESQEDPEALIASCLTHADKN